MRTVAALAGCAFALAACGEKDEETTAASSDEWAGETITIGSVYSETGIGKPFGPQQVQGAELAVDEINAAGGVEGADLKLVQVDDRSDPRVSARATRSLIEQEDALALLGPTFSNSAAEAHPVANNLGAPMLATSNTAPGIVGDCAYPCELIFRDSLGEAEAIPANVESYAAENPAAKTATVIYPKDDPFGETTAKIAADALEAKGIDAGKVELPTPLRGLALDSSIFKRTDAIFVTASSGEVAAQVIRLARRSGFKGDILGGNAFNSAAAAAAAGPDGEGARSAAAWFAGSDAPENVAFIEAYEEAYGEPPDQFAAQAYTGVQLLAEAARNSDLAFDDLAADRLALAEALSAVGIPTPLGLFSFTSDNDVSQPIWIVEMDGRGGFELIEEAAAPGS